VERAQTPNYKIASLAFNHDRQSGRRDVRAALHRDAAAMKEVILEIKGQPDERLAPLPVVASEILAIADPVVAMPLHAVVMALRAADLVAAIAEVDRRGAE